MTSDNRTPGQAGSIGRDFNSRTPAEPRFEPDESGLTGGYIHAPGSEKMFSDRQIEQGGRILDLTLGGELIG